MSDTIDDFRAMGDFKKAERKAFGLNCPICVRLLPKAHPKILLPGQRCRMHDYTDPRPQPTDDEMRAALAPHGWTLK